MRVPLVPALVCLAALVLPPAHAQTARPRIELELSLDLDPVVQEPGFAQTGRVDVQAATQHLLGEARWVLSGMIYGFRFDYTPADRARSVVESFRLDPLALIPWGDTALTVGDTRLDDRRVTVLFRYDLSAEQEGRRTAWASATMEKTAGTGSANAFLGYAQRMVALENALKESVRGHLRPRLPNRPRSVQGDLVLWEVGQTRITAGQYHSRVTARLRVAGIVAYP